MKNNKKKIILFLVLFIAFFFVRALNHKQQIEEHNNTINESVNQTEETQDFELKEYDGSSAFILISEKPNFTKEEIQKGLTSFEEYYPLDKLNRATGSFASVGKDLMPTEKRENLSYKPTGWKQNKYNTKLVNGGYLYNRCHLIGFQLTGENNNEKNLITCTRYMNLDGMLSFENMIADYVKETGNHVLYRVTPKYDGDDLLAKGVFLEALSIEDDGEGISFYAFAYNVQPGILINYSDGSNRSRESRN